jgi:hypothetical protein
VTLAVPAAGKIHTIEIMNEAVRDVITPIRQRLRGESPPPHGAGAGSGRGA